MIIKVFIMINFIKKYVSYFLMLFLVFFFLIEIRYKNRFCKFCNLLCVDVDCIVLSCLNFDCRLNLGLSVVWLFFLNMLFRFNGVFIELNVNGDVCIIF